MWALSGDLIDSVVSVGGALVLSGTTRLLVARGISTRIVLPTPGSLVAETVPSCNSTMLLTIASPRPVPTCA
jgi:hypothetical protein